MPWALERRLTRPAAIARGPWWLGWVVCAVVFAALFALDLATPLTDGEWLLYLVPVIGTLWMPHPRSAIYAAGIGTILLLAGLIMSPAGGIAPSHAMLYRIAGLGVLWTTAGLITARRQSDRAVRIAYDHISHVLSSSPVVLYSLRIDGAALQPLWISENFQRMTGYASEEPFSFAWWIERVHPDDLPRLGGAADVLAHEHVMQEYRFRRADGSYFWVRNDARILCDAAGRPIEMIGSWLDVSDRKRAEEEVEQTRDQLFRVLSLSPVVTYTLRLDRGRVTEVWNSENVSRITGYPREETLNLVWWLEHMHPDDRPGPEELAATLHREHTVREFRFRCADGSYAWIRDEARLLRDAGGEPVEIVGAWADITAQRHADEALREIGRLHRDEAEVATALARVGRELMGALGTPGLLDHLCRVTAEVLDCGASLTLLWRPEEDVYVPVAGYGMTPDQQAIAGWIKVPRQLMLPLLARLDDAEVSRVGTIPTDLVSAVEQERLGLSATLCMALRRGRTLIGVQVVLARAAGATFRPVEWRIAHGIAQLASVALEHARVVEELNQASRVKSEFVATMSHELRTPIGVIVGYADLLAAGEFGPLSAEQADTIAKLNRSARELLELINATLDLGRFEAGQLPLVLEDVAPADLLAEVRAETRTVRDKPALAVEWRCAPDLPALHTDRVKLKTVLKNLVHNAVKFTERGEVVVRAAAGKDDGIVLTVRDTGIGIAADVLPIIFEPFRQADGSTTRRYGGVGLGLYIVRRFVDLLGGTVTVESELGRGATFRVWIPRHPQIARAAA